MNANGRIAAALAATLVCSIASLAEASTFVGEVFLRFHMASSRGGGLVSYLPAPIYMTTDYGAVSGVEIPFSLPTVAVAGSPDDSFEITLAASGVIRSNRVSSLNYVDSANAFFGSSTSFVSDFEFTTTSRVGSLSEVVESGPQTTTSLGIRGPQVDVTDYPESIGYASRLESGGLGIAYSEDLGTVEVSIGVYHMDDSSYRRGIDITMRELLPGDFNDDGVVDAADYTIWRDAAVPLARLLTDYTVWSEGYASSLEGPTNAEVVPEPSALLLVTSVAIWIACNQRS